MIAPNRSYPVYPSTSFILPRATSPWTARPEVKPDPSPADPVPAPAYAGDIENYVGMTQVPTGLAGPLRLLGPDAQGEVCVPLATTEGALVASYSRGAKACTAAGGVYVAVLAEGIQRSPMFVFRTMAEAMRFQDYSLSQQESFPQIIQACSRHARFERMQGLVEGNQFILHLEFTTGDAAGQNMATFCADEICRFLLSGSPVRPERWYLENDQKGGAAACGGLRGKKAGAEIVLPAAVVADVLKSTPQAITACYRKAVPGSSGGINGHMPKGLTALFLACGQDIASVAAAPGFTRMECTQEGDLYAAVTLPNLAIDAGTGLPTQSDFMALLGCRGDGRSRRFAAICAAIVLCGEVSIAADMAGGSGF
jgi:hydroxymethylglutaryl-CoA reductase (NADPH)